MPAGVAQRFIRTFKSSGVRETARRSVLHVTRKISERRYVRKMMPAPEELARQRAEVFADPVQFSIIVPLYNTPLPLLREMLQSVRNQSYESWELCLADGSDEAHAGVEEICRKLSKEDPRILYRKLEKNEGISGNSNAALAMAGGDYIALFDHDDLLMPNALYEAARAIRLQGADFVYTDELIFRSPHPRRVVGIRFKPDYAPEDLLTNNYICHLTVFRRELLQQVGGFRSEYDGSQDHDLVLRLTGAAQKVVHIPKVLYLWRSIPGSVAADVHMKEYAISAGQNAVRDFLHKREGREIPVCSTEVFPTMYRIDYPLEGTPSVRVLLDGAVSQEALRRLERQTSWPHVHFQPLAEEKGGSRCRRMAAAASSAREDFLIFLSAIPEIITLDWIQALLRHARRPEIGAVGARVQFQKNELRHAGVILGLGAHRIAGRPYFNRYDDRVGFFGQLAVVRQVSAVTDCWMIRSELFRQAGGFDRGYQDSLFDIDFCLTLREKGLRNLWIPDACLKMGTARELKMEVGAEQSSYAADSILFRQKWQKQLTAGDPFYNPNLSLDHEDWRIAPEK